MGAGPPLAREARPAGRAADRHHGRRDDRHRVRDDTGGIRDGTRFRGGDSDRDPRCDRGPHLSHDSAIRGGTVRYGTVASGDPIAGRPGLVAEFAQQLNALRRQARLTYQQLADRNRGKVSRSTWCRAVSGKSLPQWRTVSCFVRTCDGDEGHWHAQYRAARDALDAGETEGLVFSPSPVPTAPVSRRLPTVREAISNRSHTGPPRSRSVVTPRHRRPTRHHVLPPFS